VQSRVRLRTNRFSVGYSTFLSPSLIEIIRELGVRRRSDVAMQYESSLTESCVAKVIRGELDAGFGYLPLKEPSLLVRKIYEEHLAVLLPAGHSLAAKRAIAPEALESVSMIAFARGALPLRFEETENHFRSLGIKLHFVEDCFSSAEATASVARYGICLLLRSRARSGDGVLARPLDDLLLT
jgi:DNA-binding transcriptional LysR family regulator